MTDEPDRQDGAPPPVPPEGPLPVGSGRRRWTPRPATDGEARALASGLRLRILRIALHEAVTNAEIAAALDRPPASVLHHVRTLVATGFLVPDPPRAGRRGAREVPYRASGKSFAMLGGGAPGAVLDALSGELAEVPAAVVEVWRLGLRLDETALTELRDRLDELLREVADRPPSPGGRTWSLHAVLHPEPGSVPPDGPQPELRTAGRPGVSPPAPPRRPRRP